MYAFRAETINERNLENLDHIRTIPDQIVSIQNSSKFNIVVTLEQSYLDQFDTSQLSWPLSNLFNMNSIVTDSFLVLYNN